MYTQDEVEWLSKLPVHLAFGKLRREAIKQRFRDNPDWAFIVNACGCPNLRYDADLRRLLKDGFLRRVREKRLGNCSYTVLRLNR